MTWAPTDADSRYQLTSQIMDEAFRTTVVSDVSFMEGAEVQRGGMACWDVCDERIDEQTFERRNMAYRPAIILTQMCFDQRLAYTENDYMCLASGASKRRRDVTYLLSGGPVPFVLRELSAGNFMLIGECYVHGCMDGEFSTPASEMETFPPGSRALLLVKQYGRALMGATAVRRLTRDSEHLFVKHSTTLSL